MNQALQSPMSSRPSGFHPESPLAVMARAHSPQRRALPGPIPASGLYRIVRDPFAASAESGSPHSGTVGRYVLAHLGQTVEVSAHGFPCNCAAGIVVQVAFEPSGARSGPCWRASRIERADSERGTPWLHAPQPHWIVDQAIYRQFVSMVDDLRPPLRELIHEVVRADQDLVGLLRAPGSIRGHHSSPGGLIAHTTDMMAMAGPLCEGKNVDRDLVLAMAALHDIGKAREYVQKGDWFGLTETGQLVGHKVNGISMIDEALHRVGLDLRTRDAIVNAVSGCFAGAHAGLREPQTIEAQIVSAVDRLSAAQDLCEQLGGSEPGWTEWHRHAPGRGFLVMPKAG